MSLYNQCLFSFFSSSFVLILLSMLFDPIPIHIYTYIYLYIDILYTTSSTAVVSGRIIRIMVKY